MQIRNAHFPDDFEKLYALNSVLSPDESRDYFSNEVEKFKGQFFLAEEKGEVIGFTSLSYPFWNKIGLILHLAVADSSRSKGIGTKLIGAVINEANQKGLRFVTVRTASWNTRAIQFYERNRFSQKAKFEDYFGDDNTMVWLQRDLR